MSRFSNLARSYGFRITPVYAMINNVWCRRPDIVGVSYQGHNIMTAPAKPLNFPDPTYKTLDGMEQPMYFDREFKLRNWNLIIKNTNHIQNLIQKKVQVRLLEAKEKKHV
jgi:hypothetical protein